MVRSPDEAARLTGTFDLGDGTSVRIRPVLPEDKPKFRDGFANLSAASRYLRFMTAIDELSEDMLRFLTEVDYVDHFAWVAAAADDPDERGIGVARYIRVPNEPEVAETAVTVVDEYQRRGLGTLLLEALGTVALRNGIRRFRGYVLEENRPMREVLEGVGARLTHEGGGIVRAEVDLEARAARLAHTELGRRLRELVDPGSSET